MIGRSNYKYTERTNVKKRRAKTLFLPEELDRIHGEI